MKKLRLLAVALALSAASLAGCKRKNNNNNDTPDQPDQPEVVEHVHSFTGAWQTSAEAHWKVCDGANCNEIAQKGEHTFELASTDPQSCSDVEHKHYRCSVCGYEKIVDGKERDQHEYTSKVTKEPTCVATGEVTFECSKCHDKYVGELPIEEDAHKWDAGTTVDGVTTYRCLNTGCEHVKKAISAKTELTAEVNADALKAAGAIELKEAQIEFDQGAMEEFEGNVSISAEPVEASTVEMSDEVKEKIGDNKIIDFSLKNGEEAVSTFNGKVRVSIPYELKANESKEGISILYLSDGDAELMEAKYADGQVSFETSHFSYYSVAHYDPAEICEKLGHIMMKGKEVKSNCAVHGYSDSVCRRCGHSEHEELPLTTHNYVFENKVEPTHTAEGYIKYTCSVCHDSYTSPIPRLSDEDKGFYLTFLESLLNGESSINGVYTLNGESSELESYSGFDERGQVYSYNYTSGGSESGLYKGYTLHRSDSSLYLGKSSDNGSSSVFNSLLEAKSVIAQYTGQASDIVQAVGDFTVEKFFVKSETPEGYSIALNVEAVVALIKSLCNDSIKQVIDGVFGEGSVDKWLLEVNDLYDLTVGDALDFLTNKGFDLASIYNTIISMMVDEEDREEVPTFDQMFNDEVKAANLMQYVIGMASMASPTASAMIPTTAEGMIQLLNGFLNANLFEILSMMMSSGSSSSGSSSGGSSAPVVRMAMGTKLDEIKSEILKVVEVFKDKLSLVIKTTSQGAFVSLQAKIDTLTVPEEIAGAEVSFSADIIIKNGVDRSYVTGKLEALYADCYTANNVLVPSASNNEWLLKGLKEQTGLEFEYHDNYFPEPENEYSYEGTAALVSKEDLTVVTGYRYDYETGKDVPEETLTGKIIYRLRDPERIYTEVYINYDGLGNKVAKGDYAVRNDLSGLTSGLYFSYKDEAGLDAVTSFYDWKGPYIEESEGQYVPAQDKYNLYSNELGFLYSFTTKQIYSGNDDNFDYITTHSYRYVAISEEEFPYRVDHGNGNGSYKYLYFKGVCEHCGAVTYTYTQVPTTNYVYERSFGNTTYFLSKDMNEAALANPSLFAAVAYIDNSGKITYHLSSYAIGLGLSSSNSVELKQGNATIKVEKKLVSECSYLYTWSIKVNDQVFKSGSYRVHSFVSGKNSSFIREVKVDDCHSIYFHYRRCECCNKVFYDYADYESHHDYHLVAGQGQAPTLTQPGYQQYECSVCHDITYDVVYPCTHPEMEPNEEKGTWVCPDCGYEVSVEEFDSKPPFAFEYLGYKERYEGEAFGFIYYRTSYYYEAEWMLQNYQVTFTLAYLDKQSGEYVYFDDEVLAELHETYEYDYEKGFGYEVFYLVVNEAQYQSLVAAAQASNPEVTWCKTLNLYPRGASEGQEVNVYTYVI